MKRPNRQENAVMARTRWPALLAISAGPCSRRPTVWISQLTSFSARELGLGRRALVSESFS